MLRDPRRDGKWCVHSLLALLGLLLAPPASAGVGVISVNLHRIECNQADHLPLTLAADPNVDLLSFHTFGSSVTQTTCVVNAALSRYTSYGKPKIVASDGGIWTNAAAASWIDLIAPQEHYEHYERFFDRSECQQTGDSGENDLACIPNLTDDEERAACGAWRLPLEGQSVSTAAHLPQCPRGTTSHQLRTKLGNRASLTRPNGRLYRQGSDLAWALGSASGSPITLMGYSWMGALTGLNFQPDGYLTALKGFGSNGINLTRVWAIEQWTALQIECTGSCPSRNGLTPFVGDKAAAIAYDLDQPNPVFYRRLRNFVQKAADRGVAVQLSLFDKHGLIRRNDRGQWLDSPYRNGNNAPQAFLTDALPSDTVPRPEFVFWNEPSPPIADIHREYLARVVNEVGGTGNVIFEIFNEAREQDWPDNGDTDAMSEIEEFQIAVAGELRRLLPTWSTRDAFNDETDGALLDGKTADTGETWWASNARVRLTAGTGTRYNLGRVVSQENGAALMSAALPIKALDASRRSASVAADLARTRGTLAVGFQNGTDSLSVQFDGSTYRLQLHTPAGARTLATYTPPNAPSSTHVRLVLNLVTSRASVYVDSQVPAELNAVWVPGQAAPFDRAFLGGWSSGAYLESDGSVDNFEASFTCDSCS